MMSAPKVFGNIELKAYCLDLDFARQVCKNIGSEHVTTGQQKDTFFPILNGKLKYRVKTPNLRQLIYYNRPNVAAPKVSRFNLKELDDSAANIIEYVIGKFERVAVVRKIRETYRYKNALIHLDEVEGLGSFLEIEVELNKENDGAAPKEKELTAFLQKAFKVSDGDLSSYSYAELIAMKRQSELWIERYRNSMNPGSIVLIDGASCSGKTSITHELLRLHPNRLHLSPRFTTRTRRVDSNTESEYVFIDMEEFTDLAMNGKMFEYRDFEFGMSYGLGWENTFNPAIEGKDVVGILNLASVTHVKRYVPDAVVVLIHAPLESISRRLRSRGFNSEEQIKERIENAKSITKFTEYYDHIVENSDGGFDEALNQIDKIVLDCRRK